MELMFLMVQNYHLFCLFFGKTIKWMRKNSPFAQKIIFSF